MKDLTESREAITRIDRQMAALFEERMKVCADIAAWKGERGLPVKDAAREADVIARNRQWITDPVVEEYYVRFQRHVMDVACAYEERMLSGLTVAYSGVPGAFAWVAAKHLFPTAKLVQYGSFSEAYAAVEEGACDCAVLPVENSSAGEVGQVTDLMFSGPLHINRVYNLPVRHQLLGCPGAKLSDIRTVKSHPQALDQCRQFLEGQGLVTIAAGNTAMAAQAVAEAGDVTVAAIASAETASLFGLTVLEENIQDSDQNTTRFAVFSRVENRPAARKKDTEESFILVFTVKNEAGALAQTLNIIGAHGFNMRGLRSRPMKDLPWNYYFYVEAEGNIHNENGQDMLRELGVLCAGLKLVGSFDTDGQA